MIKLNRPLRLIQTAKRRNDFEGLEQQAFFDWLKLVHPFIRALSFAIPNGGYRLKAEAIRLMKQGVTPGVPDLFVALPTEYYAGLFIEMKVGKNTTTGLQQAFIARLREVGYRVDVCYSFEEAQAVLLDYIKGSKYV